MNKFLIIQHVVKVLILKKISKKEEKFLFWKHTIRNEISFEGNFQKKNINVNVVARSKTEKIKTQMCTHVEMN